jgi:hypothetical protein|tara:strand:- start:421 stop:786 length:366 start_codon:yes stop_codon:yes gene_type:complete
MKSFTLKVLKETKLENGDSEIEFGFDDDFVEFYENKFKKKLTQENFQEMMLEAIKEKAEEGDGLDKYMKKTFKKELLSLINTYCMEADSDTPDYILAEYMIQCLKLFNKSTQARDMHMGIK